MAEKDLRKGRKKHYVPSDLTVLINCSNVAPGTYGLLLVLTRGLGLEPAVHPTRAATRRVCRGLFVKGKTLYSDRDYGGAQKMTWAPTSVARPDSA